MEPDSKSATQTGNLKTFVLNVVQRRSIEENTETISKIFPDVSTGKGYFTEKQKQKQWIKNS